MASVSFPYEAIAIKKYKSPHKGDLSFAKGDRIRVTSIAPKDDDDDDDDDEPDQWVVGETLDGSKSGTFPASHVEAAPVETPSAEAEAAESTPHDEEIPAQAAAVESAGANSAIVASPEKDSKAIVDQKKAPADAIDSAGTVSAATTSEAKDLPATNSTSAAAVSPIPAPERKASSPPVAPKPSGLAARIAAFNKPQEAPPPLPKGKPGVWKRPAPAAGAPKPVLPGAAPAQQARSTTGPPTQISTATTSPPLNATSPEVSERSNAAFSAADAQSSIKMSLKERMAALQRGESSSEAASTKSAAPPRAAPGRIAEEKRNVAMAGMGAVSQSSQEPAAADEEPAMEDRSPLEGETDIAENTEAKAEDMPGDEDNAATEVIGEVEGEKTEEEIESERRAAIAKRMAALGGRKMGAGPAMFGAPAPPPVKKPSIEVPQSSMDEGADKTAVPSPISAEPTLENEEEVAQPSKKLAVPRRAAPPRKKKSTSSATSAEAAPSAAAAITSETMPSREGSLQQQTTSDTVASAEDVSHLEGTAATEASPIQDEEETPIVDDVKDVSEGPHAAEVASSYGDITSDFEPGTPISEGQMDENARKLEEFIRTPMEERDDTIGTSRPTRQASIPPLSMSTPPPASSDATIPRPPSTRPPVPKTPITIEDESIKRRSSPAPTRPPPAIRGSESDQPSSPAPMRTAPIPKTPTQRDVQQFAEPEVDDDDEPLAVASSQPTIIAAPKARLAVPVEPSDDEAEDEDNIVGTSFAAPSTPAATEAVTQPSEALSEEEEDRQRRARIAAKMAKMGGQPIMGAPIAFKKSSTAPEAEEHNTLQEDARGLEPEVEEGSEIQAEINTPKRDASIASMSGAIVPSVPTTATPPPIPTAKSPPPMPKSPPPMPSKSPPPMMGSASLDKRFSQMSTDEDTSLGRRASLLTRSNPPGKASREASTADEDDEMDDTTAYASVPKSPAPRAPPPRAPPPVRQPSLKREPEMLPPLPPTPAEAPTIDSPAKTSRDPISLNKRAQSGSRSSRDLDLMPSSQWWRHGRPVRLPPTLSRPDVLPIISTQDEDSTHLIRIELIFEDYSSTVVEVQYQDDDSNEQATQISQHHNFAPRRPSTQELQSWSQQYGSSLARVAMSALQSKAVLGNGTSKGFISELIVATGNDDVLPCVGSSFGSIVLAQAATTPVDIGADELRAGDVIALHGVDLKGKKGITSYHATFGSTQEPTYACVIESEAKKRKLRCILVPGLEAKKASKIPEEVSLRLDDVKSGLLRVFRLAPKSGWLSS